MKYFFILFIEEEQENRQKRKKMKFGFKNFKNHIIQWPFFFYFREMAK